MEIWINKRSEQKVIQINFIQDHRAKIGIFCVSSMKNVD